MLGYYIYQRLAIYKVQVCVWVFGNSTWDLLNDLIDLLHEDLLQEDQVVEQVCGQVVLEWTNLHIRGDNLKINKGCSLNSFLWPIVLAHIGSLLPQLHSAGSCLEDSFLALLESHQEPSPGLSGSRGPPWCTLLTWWLGAGWGWLMVA